MKFRFKLTYLPKDGESLAELLGRHEKTVRIEDRYQEGCRQIAVCASSSLADGLRISIEIGAEVELLQGDGELD